MMQKITVLGCGLVGAPMVRDLAADKEWDILAVDNDDSRLRSLNTLPGVRTLKADLNDQEALASALDQCDLALNATPGFMGFNVFRTAIEHSKNIVDIAFFPEDPFPLDALAKEKGVTALMDMGVAPGLSHLMAGYAFRQMEECHSVKIYVGGLPRIRRWPFEYKAVFSPADVIEEYTRPARYMQKGTIVTQPALSEPELLDFPTVGTLEAFNSDGLRSLLVTLDVPDMIEKTLRYPGHAEKMRILRESGFFSKEPVEIRGTMISPLEFTSRILFPQWKLEEDEQDITIMRVVVDGLKDGEKCRFNFDLTDEADKVNGIHSMARTTGYSATAAVRMLLEERFTKKGVITPEMIPETDTCTEYIFRKLEERGISIARREIIP